uniref:Uncharacterized protein n=1 Tax=Glossina palpalis gambiensis TaxID=67801 RepID=A0A1B0BMF2_9MUSC
MNKMKNVQQRKTNAEREPTNKMLFIKRTFIIRQAYVRLRYKLPSLSTYLMDMQVCFAQTN